VGWGDEIIVTGQAREAQRKVAKKVVVLDRLGRVRGHDIWANNPRIVNSWDRVSDAHRIVNGPGVRPYIAGKSDHRWQWRDFVCPIGELYFSVDELAYAARFAPAVLIEPNNKAKASPNKDWGKDRWQALVILLRKAGMVPTQIGPVGTQLLQGVSFIQTPTFRHGCAILARCRAAVLPEGGLHHAAAALGVPSVVIYGGYISPRQTGYDIHRNLFTGGEPCGMRTPCAHCKKAMGDISPEEVVQELLEVIKCRISMTPAI